MRLGIDSRALQTQPWGGVGQYTYNLLRALFELDQKNEYVVWYNAFGNSDSRDRVSIYPTFSQYPNVRIRRTRWPNKILNIGMKFFSRPKSEIGNRKLEIFLMPNLNFIALPESTKLVLTVHDLSFVHFPEHFSRKTRLWHRAVNPCALFTRADKIIAVSEHTKGDLMETYGISEKKINIIYPGINQTTSHSELASLGGAGEKSRADARTPFILYFGALEPRKNIQGLIEAYELLHSQFVDSHEIRRLVSHLIIAGLSTPYVRHLKRRIAKSSLRDRITLIENPSEEQKADLYAGACLFVYPSYYEGFGFPPLEAMAAGVPVVASSASSVPEICGDAAVLVSPWKVDEIAAGMRVLLADDQLRHNYIAAGYERVKKFSWQQCAQQLSAVFQNMV